LIELENIKILGQIIKFALPLADNSNIAIIYSAAQEIWIWYYRCKGPICRIVSQCMAMAVDIPISIIEQTTKHI